MRTIMKTSIILVVLMVSMCFVSVTVFAEGAQEEKPVKLQVWSRNPEMEQAVKMFNDKMKGEGRTVRAELQVVPWGQQSQKLMAAMAAGKAPDIFSLGIGRLRYFVEQGAFLDITEKAKNLPYFDQFPENMVAIGKVDGKLHALPAIVDLSGMVYNKELFREAGLDPSSPPPTWEDLIEYGKKLTKDTDGDGNIDQWAYHLADYTGFWYLPFIWSNGGMYATIDNEVKFGSDAVKEFVQLWYDILNTYKIAPKASLHWRSSDWYNSFITGKLAMMHGGNFNVETIQKDAPELDFGVGFIPKPKDGEYWSYAGGNSIGITNQTDYPDECWEFIEFYFSEEVMTEAFIQKNNLPARVDLYDNEYFNNEAPIMKDFAALLKQSRVPVTAYYSQFKAIAEKYIERALLQQMSVDEAVDKAAAEMREVIAEATE